MFRKLGAVVLFFVGVTIGLPIFFSAILLAVKLFVAIALVAIAWKLWE